MSGLDNAENLGEMCGADKPSTLKDAVRINERPAEVIGRLIPGHWEGDLVMGKERNSVIGMLVERTTRAIIIVHLKGSTATGAGKAFEKEFKTIPKRDETYHDL